MEAYTATPARAPASGSVESPPRLTFVTDIVTPYIVSQLEELAKRSTLHAVFCSRDGTRGLPWDLASRLSFAHDVVAGVSFPSHIGGTDYHLSPRILWSIARSRPDAVIVDNYSFPAVYASLYCAAAGRPLVIHCEGTPRTERRLGGGQTLARKALLRVAAGCAATSAPAAERFRELGVAPDRIFMTPHTTNLDPLWQVAQERTYDRPGPLRVLGVGRLLPRKGFDRLLRAVARAIGAGAEVELRIVGRGPEEESLRRLAEELGIGEYVGFDGFVDQDGLPAVYAEADAFAFPTLRDTFGIVLVEAAAAGLPLVASPEGGATLDLVEHDHNGLVVHPDDVDALAQSLARLAREPELRERLGRAAHRSTLERTPAAAARGFLDAVEAAYRRPGRALA